MAVLDEIKGILLEVLDVDESQIKPEAHFTEDLGADSLDLVEIIMTIEEKYDIEIPDQDAEKLNTVQEAIDYLKDRDVVRGE